MVSISPNAAQVLVQSSPSAFTPIPSNPTANLYETCQQMRFKEPEFKESTSGPQHAPTFECVASVNGYSGRGQGASKKEAKHNASRDLLDKIPNVMPKSSLHVATVSSSSALQEIRSRAEKLTTEEFTALFQELLLTRGCNTPLPLVGFSQSIPSNVDSSTSLAPENSPSAQISVPIVLKASDQPMTDPAVLSIASQAPKESSSPDKDRMDFLLKMSEQCRSSAANSTPLSRVPAQPAQPAQPSQPAQPARSMPPIDSDHYPGCDEIFPPQTPVASDLSISQKIVEEPAPSAPDVEAEASSGLMPAQEPLVIPGSELVKMKAALDKPYRTVLGAVASLASKYQSKAPNANGGPPRPIPQSSTERRAPKSFAKNSKNYNKRDSNNNTREAEHSNARPHIPSRGPKVRLSVDKICRPTEDLHKITRVKCSAGPQETTADADNSAAPVETAPTPSVSSVANGLPDASSVTSATVAPYLGPPLEILEEANSMMKQLFQKLQLIRDTQGPNDSKLFLLVATLHSKGLHLAHRYVTEADKYHTVLFLSYKGHYIMSLVGSSSNSQDEADTNAVRRAVLTWLSPILSKLDTHVAVI